jgi:acyl-[acyl-carrier-protein]-phospholipid O-acyltransferase/long-chain-fatty-acid--[acyl-carrier-protein] ligase
MVLVGVSAGFYIIPLDTSIQVLSPLTARGRNVAAGTFLSFVGVLIASLLIAVVDSAAGFIAIGLITLLFIPFLTHGLHPKK